MIAIMKRKKVQTMNEIELLKLRLENAIEGHRIAMHLYPDKETEDMLKLLQDCHAVVSRIVIVEDDLR